MKYELEEGMFADKLHIELKLRQLPSDDDAKVINNAITVLKQMHKKYTKTETQE